MKILLIDDHELVAECLRYTLIESGKCEYVEIMTDIPAAIEAILNGEFDLVLLDINLKRISDKDGLVLAKEILQRDPNIKIIMLTGYDLPILEIEAQKIGARGFICKDLQLDKLMNIIERIMSGEKGCIGFFIPIYQIITHVIYGNIIFSQNPRLNQKKS